MPARPGSPRSLAILEAYEAARDPARYAEAITRVSAIAGVEDDTHGFVRLSADAITSSCAHALGDLTTAAAGYARLMARGLQINGVSQFLFTALGLGRLRALEAGPVAARRSFEEALAAAAERGWDALPVSAILRYGLGQQQHEMGELAAAEATYEQALSLAAQEPTTTRHPLILGLARVHYAQGHEDACDELLARLDAEPFIRPLMPVLPDLGVERAWIDLARGRLDVVQAWLNAHGVGEGAALYGIHGVHDAADLLVGRYLLLRGRHARAISVLTDTLHAAVAAGRVDTVVRCRIDLAVARYLEGERAQAFSRLPLAADRDQPRHRRRAHAVARQHEAPRLSDGLRAAQPRVHSCGDLSRSSPGVALTSPHRGGAAPPCAQDTTRERQDASCSTPTTSFTPH